MSKSASMYIRIDPQVKADVEAIYSRYGMSITDAINVFLYQSRNVDGLPFNLCQPASTPETSGAFEEVRYMKEASALYNPCPDSYEMMKAKGDVSMQISVSELRTNTAKYVDLANGQDILITKNGKYVAKIVGTKIDKTAAMKSIFGIIPPDADLDRAKEERLL